MYAVIAEVEPKDGNLDKFLHYYKETIVPFAHSKTKVKDIKVMVSEHDKTVTIVRTYDNKADTEPLKGDNDYDKIVSTVADLLSRSPKKRTCRIHS